MSFNDSLVMAGVSAVVALQSWLLIQVHNLSVRVAQLAERIRLLAGEGDRE